MSCRCRSTPHSDRSETCGTLCAVVVDHTSRNILRGHRLCRERSSVDRVYQCVSIANERRSTCTDLRWKFVFGDDVTGDVLGY